jgi:peroxiredoxin
LEVGASIAPLSLATAAGETLSVPDDELTTHLQLRRFAGCPICHLHLRSMVERHEEIGAAGIREVVVFHSTATELTRFAPDVPFPLVPDPDRRLYRELGVEASPRALLHPGAWGATVGGPRRAFDSLRRGEGGAPLRPSGGRLGLPADFLIAPDGRLRAVKYGLHAYDQWSVDELLAL